MSNIPSFGHCKPGVQYVERPGAYGFLLNAGGEIAVIQTSFGFFLPGGGLDPGEDEVTGLRREIQEEIAHELLTAELVTRAAQYHWSEYYQQFFRKVGAFYNITTRAPATPRFQNEHSMVWWPIAHAEQKLTQEFQRWALKQR